MTSGLTDALAWIGALTGVAALIWQIATGRRSAHHVAVGVSNAFLTHGAQLGEHMISVTAINKGAAPVTITAWGIQMGDSKENAVQMSPITGSTPLPHRLENGADANFFMLAVGMREAHAQRHLPYAQMRPWVQLATGKRVFANRGVPLAD